MLGARTHNVRQGGASTANAREKRPRRLLVAAFLNFGLGLFFLTIGFNRPTIANMRTLDLGYLLATGDILTTGLVALVLSLVFRFRREAEAEVDALNRPARRG